MAPEAGVLAGVPGRLAERDPSYLIRVMPA